MPASIDVLIEDDRWNDVPLTRLCNRAIGAVFAARGLSGKGYEVSVLACDDARIAELNAEFRGKPAPTNVLSWPAFELAPLVEGDEPAPPPDILTNPMDSELGDIAVSFDTCFKEAEAGKLEFEDHLTHLLAHSCLHLLGFDHETDADAARMEGLETKILASLGIADPY
ncbi:rRNA maturation RNase YbeY [Neptunicoccus sediminis]|uniref:rRNA maturation RNase YbeY n=1 Tax=Neptunicoccus sediminis TaxID=1892596 RepID=UPI0008460FB5|nr:rRNA maturation RNase YbeY [Neptunicoccus sediminis]